MNSILNEIQTEIIHKKEDQSQNHLDGFFCFWLNDESMTHNTIQQSLKLKKKTL